jgi:hypothetical protein
MGANDAAEMLEEAKAEIIRLERLVAALRPREIHHEAEVADMPRGTVLLCRENEVFWLPPAAPGDLDAPRLWFAPGYNPDYYSLSDSDVADWAPLMVLKVGD